MYALSQIAKSNDKRYIIIQAPTGVGKTLLGVAAARILGKRTIIYTCHTKDLQDQMVNDFDAVLLQGRANYPAGDHEELFPEVTCAECEHSDMCGTCPCAYTEAKRSAKARGFACLNTAYHLNITNHGKREFMDWDACIFDEGDLLESAVIGYASVDFTRRTLSELGMDAPEHKGTGKGETRVEEWTPWLNKAIVGLESLSKSVSIPPARIDPTRHARAVRKRSHYERLAKATAAMLADLKKHPDSWVLVDSDGVTFKPVYAHGHKDLWDHADVSIIMSATIISHDQFCEDLGIDINQSIYLDLPCPFPAENRPIYFYPAGSMSAKMKQQTLPKLVKRIDEIADCYPFDRILIHTHTYDIAKYICANSRLGDRMATYTSGYEGSERSKTAAMRRHREKSNSILVAPSLDRGVNFADDLARCQIVAKVPFPYLGDRQVSARFHGKGGQVWYRVQTIRAFVQATGRGMRHMGDWCDTYILDDDFRGFRQSHLIPEWWREAVAGEEAARAALERAAQRALARA